MIKCLKLGCLSSSQTARLDELVNLWSACSCSIEPIEQDATERAVYALYSWYGLALPEIIWCQSPWQIATMYMLSNLQPRRRDSSLDLSHSLAASGLANRPEEETLLSRLGARITGKPDNCSSSQTRTRRFLPIRAPGQDSVFYRTRRPLLSPVLRPALYHNIVTFAPSCRIDVGFSGRNTLRRTAEQFEAFSALPARRQMLSLWPEYLLESFADRATRESVNSFLVGRTNLNRNWPLDDYNNWQTLHGKPNAFSEATSLIPNLIWFSSWSSEWFPIYEFLLDHDAFASEEAAELEIWLELARHAAAYSFFESVCLVSDRPRVLSCDERARLHHASNPALSFADGQDLYSWHGVTCPREIIEEPEKISVSAIEAEMNAEIKRIMIERFGLQRYLTESENTKIHEDDFGTLYLKQVGASEPIAMVRVINSTPESDGTYKEYFLRVPPTVTTAREAVAWTFNLEPEEYHPSVES